jgi:signal peptidase I
MIGDPSRGDIVVINFGDRQHACFDSVIVKRIVGLPGDMIEQRHGRVWVNERVLREPYIKIRGTGGPDFAKQRIRWNWYFVMGDNREASCDSREFGPIPRSAIIAKVIRSIRG